MALLYLLSMNWRLIDSGSSEPEFTVAADEAIALARSKLLVPNTLHFYRRKCPTVSLGYFQEVEKATNRDFCKENDVRVVRRVTGGSAIYTDSGHLIYGLIVDEPTLSLDRNKAFEKVCSTLVIALDILGVKASFKPVNDVLVGGRKISGSAQMRRWGVVLQHGTLVLQNNHEMMVGALKMNIEKINKMGMVPTTYVTSLDEVLGKKADVEIVKSALVKGFEATFGVRLVSSQFTGYEVNKIKELIENKYGRDEWNLKR
jgi:lipoate-protein ligase A